MTFNKTLLTAAVLAVGGLSAISGANAAEANSSFQVNVKIDPICQVKPGTSAIKIADINGGAATANTTGGSTTLTINCSKGALARIGLQPQSTSSNVGLGEMVGGVSEEKIEYKLTSVSSGGAIWGNTDGVNTVDPEAATSYATDIDNTIYATITNTADVTPDTYTDTINVLVLY